MLQLEMIPSMFPGWREHKKEQHFDNWHFALILLFVLTESQDLKNKTIHNWYEDILFSNMQG